MMRVWRNTPLAGLLALLFICTGQCLAGSIQTLSGKVIDGVVSIGAKGELLVNRPYAGLTVVPPDDVLEATFRQSDELPAMQQGVIFTDGTTIAGQILSADETTLHYARDGQDVAVPVSRVARICFKPVPTRIMADIGAGRFGAILAKGDFFEGDFKGITGGKIRIQSVVFGAEQFVPGEQASAIILADVHPAKTDWIVGVADGSILMASSIKFDDGRLIVQDLTQGTFTLSPDQLIGYRCGLNRMESLADLKPQAVDPAAQDSVVADATTAGVPMDLGGEIAQRGVGTFAGTTVAYDLGGKYKAFVCHAGVPAGLTPVAKVSFVVLGDGKELFRSAGRTSIDDPLSIAISVADVKTLVLKSQSEQEADLGASALWAEPALVK